MLKHIILDLSKLTLTKPLAGKNLTTNQDKLVKTKFLSLSEIISKLSHTKYINYFKGNFTVNKYCH